MSNDTASPNPQSATPGINPDNLEEQIRHVGAWWDLLVLGAIPAILLGVFLLPDRMKWRLALDYTAPTMLTAFTSHFVHFSARHLLVNLLGGAVVVPTAYLLSVLSGRRQQFFVAYTCFVVAFPFALSGLNLVFVRSTVGVGFSGIILAFVGYLAVALVDFVGEWYDTPVDGTQSAWLFFLSLALISFTVSVHGHLIAFISFLASLLFFTNFVRSFDRERLLRVEFTTPLQKNNEPAVFGIVVFLVYPLIMISMDYTTSYGIVNIYSHVLGFCLGYITTYLMTLVDGFQ